MSNKLYIGIMIACMFAVGAGVSEAAMPKRTVVKAVGLVKKTCNDIASTIWKNKGAIAVGTAAVAVASKPEAFVQGATAMVTETAAKVVEPRSSSIGRTIICVVLAMIVLAGVRSVLRSFGAWSILPIMLGIVLLGCGIAEAGVISGSEVRPAIASTWWNALGWIVIILITVFMETLSA